ncbi:MAG: NPCBM/NEW2 domain-containing protein [Phycisphaerales bacterium]|nr:NPCBM/NEW2 domain-containing protein [Phycisphaerales bacterium]
MRDLRRTIRRHVGPLFAAWALLSVVGARSMAQDSSGAEAILIDDELRGRSVRLAGIDGASILIVDESGRMMRANADSALALIALQGPVDITQGIGATLPPAYEPPELADQLARAAASAEAGFIETATGERLPGQLAATGGGADVLSWEHPSFGRIDLALDQVMRVVMPGMRAAASMALTGEPEHDELVLANGDVLTGFLVTLGPRTSIETDAGVVEIDAERVAATVLSNPVQPRLGLVVWLDDGTVTSASQIDAVRDGDVRITREGGVSAEYRPLSLRAIAFEASRLVPLSTLEPVEQVTLGERPTTTPVRIRPHPDDFLLGDVALLGAEDVELPSPMRVVYALPADAKRFAGTAALDPNSAPWGDCEFVVAVDGQELLRRRLHEADAFASFNIDVAGGRRLEVRVEPGAFGPIRDRVFIRRGLLLVD